MTVTSTGLWDNTLQSPEHCVWHKSVQWMFVVIGPPCSQGFCKFLQLKTFPHQLFVACLCGCEHTGTEPRLFPFTLFRMWSLLRFLMASPLHHGSAPSQLLHIHPDVPHCPHTVQTPSLACIRPA